MALFSAESAVSGAGPAARDCDLLVIGSGAAGLSAAVTAAHLGLRVILAEKAPVLGGTTAWSGGWIWAPGNPVARRAGISEDRAAPRQYLEAVLGNTFDGPRVDAFLAAAPQMVAFLESRAGIAFEGGLAIPDTYGHQPGAGTGGRSVIAAPYDGRALGPLMALLRKPMPETTFHGLTIQAGPDLRAFMSATRKLSSFVHVARRVSRHMFDLALHGRAMQLRNGQALVARLLKAAADKGVTFCPGHAAIGLDHAGGRVTGARFATPGGEVTIRARRGVLLATGGFAQDPVRRAAMFPHDAEHLSVAAPTATGDGLRLAEALGAVVETGYPAAGAWCPVSEVPNRHGPPGRFPHIIERGKPGLIAVRADGRRFCNEGLGYHDYVRALLEATPAGEVAQSWLICTRAFQRRYGLGIARPAPVPLGPMIRSGYITAADTPEALARACGIDPAGLAETLRSYNAAARRGEDPAFGRGTTPYMRLQGDPEVQPNPCVAPIEAGPFLAVRVVPGSFGTFAGLKSDARARVLDGTGAVIPGLYAAGGDLASVMGGHYPAGGINLGPALTFGYVAAQDAAGIVPSDLSQELLT